jgi:integrase/recombinase XerD
LQDTTLATFEERNKIIIEEFIRSLPSLSSRRIYKYRVRLGKISRDLAKPFDLVSQDDLRGYVEEISESEEYTDSTKVDYRGCLKKFFGWLHEKDNPKFASWIRRGSYKETVGVEEILSDVELDMLRRVCDNLRDRALIETAYETAFRPQELLILRKSSVAFDEYGATVSFETGKTGGRRVRVVNAAPLLAELTANHPLRDKKDFPLWVDISTNTQYRPLAWIGLRKLTKRLGEKAGIEKRVNPYIFRHTRLTYLAQVLTEAQLCEFAGWTIGSDMARKYVHLSGRDVDDALLRSYGMIKPKEAKEIKTPKKCGRCGVLNVYNAELCQKCGLALSIEAAIKRDEEFQEYKAKVDAIMEAIADSVDGKITISKAK